MKIFLFALMLTSLTACQNGLLMTRGDIREAEQSKKMQDTVSTTQKVMADNSSRFSDIDADMRALNGRIEVAEARAAQLTSERQQMKAGYDTLTNEQSKKILILQEEVSRLTDQVNQLSAEMSAIKILAVAEGGGGGGGGSGNTGAPAVQKDAFQIGEESFERKDWKKAILNFNKFRDSNPKSKKFGEATYKIGVSFQELGMKEEAKTFFDEVVSKFPNSSDAKKARTRLKSIKR